VIISMDARTAALMAFSLTALLMAAGTATAQSDPNPAADQWLDIEYDLSIRDSMEKVDLDGEVAIHEVEIPERSGTADDNLRRHCGGSCSADELRGTYQRAGSQEQEKLVEAIESVVEDGAKQTLRQIAGEDGTASATADASEQSLQRPPSDNKYQPAVPVDVTGQATLGLLAEANYTEDQIDALFEMGAKVTVPIEQTVEPGQNLTLTLEVPEPIAVLEASEGDIGDDGRSVEISVDNWKGERAKPVSAQFTIGRDDVVVPERTKANLEITLDVSEVDVSYTGLLGDAPPASANVRMQAEGTFESIENPRNLEKVELDYLSADAIRLAREHNLIETQQFTQLGDQARQTMKQMFADTFGVEVSPSGGFSAQTFSSAEIGSPPGTGGPVVLDVQAESAVDFPPSQPQAGDGAANGFRVTTVDAGSFTIPEFNLPVDVPKNVTLILPDGLQLAHDGIQNGEITETKTDDGRNAYTVSSNGDGQASINNAQVEVSSGFVWDVFWPLILFLFLLLVVVPAIIILLVIRRRREEDEESGGSGGGSNPIAGGQAEQ